MELDHVLPALRLDMDVVLKLQAKKSPVGIQTIQCRNLIAARFSQEFPSYIQESSFQYEILTPVRACGC